jgi:hypothetical protein
MTTTSKHDRIVYLFAGHLPLTEREPEWSGLISTFWAEDDTDLGWRNSQMNGLNERGYVHIGGGAAPCFTLATSEFAAVVRTPFPKVGSVYRLRHPVDRYPHCVVPAGTLVEVAYAEDIDDHGCISARLLGEGVGIRHCRQTLEEWDGCLQWAGEPSDYNLPTVPAWFASDCEPFVLIDEPTARVERECEPYHSRSDLDLRRAQCLHAVALGTMASWRASRWWISLAVGGLGGPPLPAGWLDREQPYD